MILVRRAQDPSDWTAVTSLFREYVDGLGFPLTFQDFERELAEIDREYGPPGGAAWLALCDDDPAGVVGLRRFDEQSGEMKRMYVRPELRGLGIGRRLGETLVEEARRLGYRQVLLDTRATMTEAIALYRSLGFADTAAYRYNPLDDAVYMRLAL